MNKRKLIGNFSAIMVGLVVTGVIATALNEQIGFAVLAAYLFGLFGQEKLAKLIEDKVKK